MTQAESETPVKSSVIRLIVSLEKRIIEKAGLGLYLDAADLDYEREVMKDKLYVLNREPR